LFPEGFVAQWGGAGYPYEDVTTNEK
jgi:hypothetical protein